MILDHTDHINISKDILKEIFLKSLTELFPLTKFPNDTAILFFTSNWVFLACVVLSRCLLSLVV